MELNLAKIKNNIRYANDPTKYFAPFFNMSEELVLRIANDTEGFFDAEKIMNDGCGAEKNGVISQMKKLEKSMLGGRPVQDGFANEEKILPEKFAEILKGIKIEKCADCVRVYWNVNGRFDYIRVFPRGIYDIIGNMNFDFDSFVTVKRVLNMYTDEKYSIAIKNGEMGIALETAANTTAIKSGAV